VCSQQPVALIGLSPRPRRPWPCILVRAARCVVYVVLAVHVKVLNLVVIVLLGSPQTHLVLLCDYPQRSCCVMGVWTSFFSSVGGGWRSMVCVCEGRSTNAYRWSGSRQASNSAHADVPGKSKRVELDHRSSAISGWDAGRHGHVVTALGASPLATADNGKA